MKSEKLTNHLKNLILQEMRRQLCDFDKERELYDLIVKTYKSLFYNNYFQSQEDIDFYLKNQNLFKKKFKYLFPENIGIKIDESLGKAGRYTGHGGGHSHGLCITMDLPQICEFDTDNEFDLNLIKKQDVYEGFRNLFKDYINTYIHNETCCDKYYSFPTGTTVRFYYLYMADNFCRPCTTTSQLKELYPEAYKYYLEVKKRQPEVITSEKKLEDLRKELGYLSKIKKQQKL